MRSIVLMLLNCVRIVIWVYYDCDNGSVKEDGMMDLCGICIVVYDECGSDVSKMCFLGVGVWVWCMGVSDGDVLWRF